MYGKRPSARHNRGGGGSFSRPKNDGNLYTRSGRVRKTDLWGREKKAANPSACFVTSACVEARGLPDDCYELCLLRLFRREYVARRPDGAHVLMEYEEKAPKIVFAIDALGSEEAQDVYQDLYERGVKRSVCLIPERPLGRSLRALPVHLRGAGRDLSLDRTETFPRGSRIVNPAAQREVTPNPLFAEELARNIVAETKAKPAYVPALTPGRPKHCERKERQF